MHVYYLPTDFILSDSTKKCRCSLFAALALFLLERAFILQGPLLVLMANKDNKKTNQVISSGVITLYAVHIKRFQKRWENEQMQSGC